MTSDQVSATPQRRWSLVFYVGAALAITLGIATQVFLAGVNVFVQPTLWGAHVQWGHAIGALIVIAFAITLAGRLPRRFVLLNGAMIGLFGLQYNHRLIASVVGVPELAAIHAVNALVLFWCATTLVRWSWQSLQH